MTEREEVVIRAEAQSTSWRGPLPHPADLAGYEEVCPGAAKAILDMAQRQALHRQELERVVVVGSDRRATLGLYFAALLSTVVMVAGVLLIWAGRDVAGLALLAGEAALLAGVFVYGRAEQRREREAKARQVSVQPELPFPS